MLTTGDPAAAGEVARAFGLGGAAHLDGPTARGEQGQVWRLTTAEGQWAVKVPFEAPDLEEAEHCTRYQEAVRAAGLPVPGVVRSVTAEVFADVGSASVRVYEWVDLEPRTPRLDPATVGRVVAGIHRVHVSEGNPVHPWYTDPIGADGWDELVALVSEAGAPFAATLAGYRNELVALEELLEWPRALQICHRDLWADNVLALNGGGPDGVCVIDWENTGLADPSQELALLLFEFACREPARASALHRAYVAAGGPGRVEGPRSFSMVVAQVGHIGQSACRQWLAAGGAVERERAEARVEEFLGDARLDRATVDTLVRAVA